MLCVASAGQPVKIQNNFLFNIEYALLYLDRVFYTHVFFSLFIVGAFWLLPNWNPLFKWPVCMCLCMSFLLQIMDAIFLNVTDSRNTLCQSINYLTPLNIFLFYTFLKWSWKVICRNTLTQKWHSKYIILKFCSL